MDDELDSLTLAEADFQKPRSSVRADQHRQVVKPKHSDRVLICVENVLIAHAVLSGAGKDDRIHAIKLS
jgi:hypothetical protein